jgi:hypothetical protein
MTESATNTGTQAKGSSKAKVVVDREKVRGAEGNPATVNNMT